MTTHRQRGGIFFKLIVLLTLAGLGLLVYALRQPLLRMVGGIWVVDDGLQPADAIIVLGDDNVPADRATRAAELYRAGWAPIVVASGRDLRRYSNLADLIQKDLENRGVPASAVVRLPHHAAGTLEEALVARDVVTRRRWHRLLLVTSNYHTRRVRYIYRKVMPESVRVHVIPARDSDYDPEHWWEGRSSIKLFLHETAGYFAALWELRGYKSLPSGSERASPAQAQP